MSPTISRATVRGRPRVPMVVSAENPPDAVAIKDGRVAAIYGDGLKELRDVLRLAGWSIWRPE